MLVEHHAATQSRARRRELGSHATPEPLARTLVSLAFGHLGRVPGLVVDPACGAGSFLLAVADALLERGVSPSEVPGRLAGCDVDPSAVAACRAALARWAVEHGAPGSEPADIRRLDPLSSPTDWVGRGDLVVGNPPFLAQRTVDTARSRTDRESLAGRFGPLGPYVDAAALFLLVALEQLAPEGVAVMIQPQSVLSARDAAAVRRAALSNAALVALWADDGRHFDAAVDVCAPVLRRVAAGEHSRQVELRWGPGAESVGAVTPPEAAESWSPLLARGLGIPEVVLPATVRPGADAVPTTIGDVASVTAGFREEFYALASSARSEGEPGWSPRASPLVTVGMLDVARLDRSTPRRIGGRKVTDPRLDRRSLRRTSPRVARWVAARSVPKVMVATQTRIPEAVADPSGRCVPVTPLVSVEPNDAGARPGGSAACDPPDVWDLLAVLSAPPVAVHLASGAVGSGLSVRAVRISASSVRGVPLPVDRPAWADGAALIRGIQERPGDCRRERLVAFGEVMCEAYGLAAGNPALDWWSRHLGSA